MNKLEKINNKFLNDINNYIKEVIENVCNDLNKETEIDNMKDKYLLSKNNKNNKNKSKNKNNNIKRGKNSYMFFLEEVRPKIQKKFPKDSIGDIAKRIGKLWNELKESDKKKYIKLAEKDKKRYKKELDKFNELSDLSETKSSTHSSSNISLLSESGSSIENSNGASSSGGINLETMYTMKK
tara:strand:- start:167 stop:712 length:546 start_codon:yes stop_codon:yes gene_type:complete